MGENVVFLVIFDTCDVINNWFISLLPLIVLDNLFVISKKHCVYHRLITIQIEHYMSFFNIWWFFVHNNFEAKAQRSFAHAALILQDRESEHKRNLWTSASCLFGTKNLIS